MRIVFFYFLIYFLLFRNRKEVFYHSTKISNIYLLGLYFTCFYQSYDYLVHHYQRSIKADYWKDNILSFFYSGYNYFIKFFKSFFSITMSSSSIGWFEHKHICGICQTHIVCLCVGRFELTISPVATKEYCSIAPPLLLVFWGEFALPVQSEDVPNFAGWL